MASKPRRAYAGKRKEECIALMREGLLMSDFSLTRTTTVEGAAAERPAALGKVLGLLTFAFAFTAGGVAVAPSMGPAAVLVSLVGGLGTLLALLRFKQESPINLGLLYAFATFEGMALGRVLDTYVAVGLGAVVLHAAAATVLVTLGAGVYGVTTGRDLSGLGNVLLLGLVGVLVAMLVGALLQASIWSLVVAGVSAALFTAYIAYDVNQAVMSREATEGDEILLAVNVYLDILNLFLNLVRVLAEIASSLGDD